MKNEKWGSKGICILVFDKLEMLKILNNQIFINTYQQSPTACSIALSLQVLIYTHLQVYAVMNVFVRVCSCLFTSSWLGFLENLLAET